MLKQSDNIFILVVRVDHRRSPISGQTLLCLRIQAGEKCIDGPHARFSAVSTTFLGSLVSITILNAFVVLGLLFPWTPLFYGLSFPWTPSLFLVSYCLEHLHCSCLLFPCDLTAVKYENLGCTLGVKVLVNNYCARLSYPGLQSFIRLAMAVWKSNLGKLLVPTGSLNSWSFLRCLVFSSGSSACVRSGANAGVGHTSFQFFFLCIVVRERCQLAYQVFLRFGAFYQSHAFFPVNMSFHSASAPLFWDDTFFSVSYLHFAFMCGKVWLK